MLKNLVKYDFKWVFKNLIIFIGLGLILSIIGRLFDLIDNSLVFKIITGICEGAAISMLLSAVINALIRTWVRTISNVYGDAGYLTNTLPVKRISHYDSKIITLSITLVVSIIATLIGLLIMYYNENTIDAIKNMFSILESSVNGSVALLIVLGVILIILQFMFIGLCGLNGIVYGYAYNDKKLSKSLVLGVGSYFCFNIVTILVFLFLGIFDDGIKNMFFNANEKVEYTSMIVLLIAGALLYCVYITVLYVLSKKKLDKGINID